MTDINNLSSESINSFVFKKIVKLVLENENKGGNVSIALVEPEEIKELNGNYRDQNVVTDVLSFNNKSDIIVEDDFIGEIVLCPNKIRKNSEEFNVDFSRELYWALIHGLLHILGYDHENLGEAKNMKEKEKYYLSFFNK